METPGNKLLSHIVQLLMQVTQKKTSAKSYDIMSTCYDQFSVPYRKTRQEYVLAGLRWMCYPPRRCQQSIFRLIKKKFQSTW